MADKKKTDKTDKPKSAADKQQAARIEEMHHASVLPATPEHPFDDATIDVVADGALAVVQKTPSARHDALVQAWLGRKNAGAIAAAAQDDAPSTVRKPARRALGVLKSRGVPIPERKNVVNLTQKPTFSIEARSLFPDGRGAQIWWVAKIASTGATDVVEITTVDRQGIVSLNRGTPTAGNLRQVWQSWAARVGRAPSEVPLDYARKRIAFAKKQSLQRKQVLPMGFDAAKELLGDDSQTAVERHPIELEELSLPTDEAAVKARIEKSMHLHEEPEFGSWLPEDSVAVEVLKTVSERVNGLPEADRTNQERVDKVVEAAIEESANGYFNEERKALYGQRMLDAAWSLYRAGLVGRAIDALLVADAIKKAGIVSDRPSDIPFVRGLFVKLLAVAQQRAAAMAPRGNEEAQRMQNP